jgi:CxxC motif-containing protein
VSAAAGKRDLVCIGCPRGCSLQIAEVAEGEPRVQGHACRRGIGYARTELRDPRRTATTTVRLANGDCPLLPVRSARPLPRAKIAEALREMKSLAVEAPVERGQVLVASLAGTGIPAVAARAVPRRH